jgi:hypothetical protein
MPSKSKAKGNAWELEVAKFLSEKYNESFLRVPSSGAFVGGKNSFRKTTIDQAQLQSKKGDIHPPAPWTHFNIECKSYADFPFHQLWTQDVKILDAWIQQQKEVEDEGDLNLILIKISRKDKWVVYPAELNFSVDRFLTYKAWIFTSWDDFWSKEGNVSLVRKFSVAGVSRTLSSPVQVPLQVLNAF